MSPSRHLAQARRDLAWLTHTWPQLLESRLKGTPRYWIGATNRGNQEPDPELSVHGKPAPLNLDVYDALCELNGWADDTSDAIAQLTGTERPELAAASSDGGWTDPTGRIAYIADRLDDVVRLDPDLADAILREAAEHARRVTTILGLAKDGHRLTFPCPYCGHEQLTVRRPDDNQPAVIVCYGPPCKADAESTGHHTFAGRRAWPQPWDNLARMVTGYAPGDVGTLTQIATQNGLTRNLLKMWVWRDNIKPVGKDMSGYPVYRLTDFAERLAE